MMQIIPSETKSQSNDARSRCQKLSAGVWTIISCRPTLLT